MSLQVSVLAVWAYSLLQALNPAGAMSRIFLHINPLVIGGLIDSAKDWISDRIPWPPFDIFSIGRAFIEWALNLIITGYLDAIGLFFVTGVEYFLLYENPRHIDALNEYWVDSLVLYVFIVFSMMFAYYVVMMLLADSEDAEIQRIVERLILSGIFLAISRELFGFFVALTNAMTRDILPEDYSFYVAIELLSALTTFIGVSITAAFIAVFGGIGVLITGILFYIALAMRMMLIYTVYAIMPVLLGLWVVDVGPGKYGKFFADMLIKLTAVMMVLGIVIAGMLSVGAAFGASQDIQGVDLASDYDTTDDGTVVLSTDPDGPRADFSDDARGGELSTQSTASIVRAMFIYIGMIWLIMAVMTSMAGMVFSAGSASPGGTGGFHGRSGGASTRGVPSAGSGGGSGASEHWPGGMGARHGSATAGQPVAYELNDGSVAVANPAGGGVRIDPSPGPFEPGEKPESFGVGNEMETFTPEENPLTDPEQPQNPFNTAPPESDGVPLTEKAKYADEQATGGMLSKAAGGVKWVGSKIPGSGLAKRGGQAYWNVFKQPDLGSSIGESLRIARDSPITGANKPPEDPPKGPVVAQGGDPFVMGRNPEQFDTGHDPTSGGPGPGPDVDPRESQGIPDDVPPHPDAEKYDDLSKLHQEGVHMPDEYTGRGPGLPHEDGEPVYGPAPTVEGYDSANDKLIHNQSKQLADGMNIGGYQNVAADDVLDELEAASSQLSQFDVAHATDFDTEQIQSMLKHQREMGVPADIAVQRTAETMLNQAADPIGGLHTEEEILDAFGIEEIPEELITDAAARRINLGREGTGGHFADGMWRIERNDGSVVYAQNAMLDSDGANVLQTEEIMNQVGVNAPTHHYDSVNRVIRSEGIEGAELEKVINGEADISPSEIDRDDFIDAYASMGLTGHNDAHTENLMVSDDGEVVPIDFDGAGGASEAQPRALEAGSETADRLGMDVNEDDIADRMEDMAEDYVENVDSTAELVGERMPEADPDVADSIAEEHSTEGMENRVDRQAEVERKKAVENARRTHKNIEDIADGNMEWQRARRGENQVDPESQASQTDIEDALDDAGFDDDPNSFGGSDSDETIDLDDPNAVPDDEPSHGDPVDQPESEVTDEDTTGSDMTGDRLDGDFDLPEGDVFEYPDDPEDLK